MHTKVRISPIGLPVLLPALATLRVFGGVEHAPRSTRLVGSVSSSMLVHNWFILVLYRKPSKS